MVIAVVVSLELAALAATAAVLHLLAAALIAARGIRRQPGGISTTTPPLPPGRADRPRGRTPGLSPRRAG